MLKSLAMDRINVYVSARSSEDAGGVERRRDQALQALREELMGLAVVSVAAAPEQAELHVEITNVVAGAAQRVLMLRLEVEDEKLDFVCSDRTGNVTAEQQAARRIQAWMQGWSEKREAQAEATVDLSHHL